MSHGSRRDVGARKVNLFQKIAIILVKRHWTPNQISVASSIFASIAGVSLLYTTQAFGAQKIYLLLFAIFGIQMRLICNLIDGLMAIEGGLKTASGELFNDVPDRVSDTVIFICAGFIAETFNVSFFHLGWIAAIIAMMTAYVRCLGAAMSGVHDFAGPMAKQHRMFTITLACFVTFFEGGSIPHGISFSIALIVIILGSTVTVFNRLRRLYIKLEKAK